VATLVIASGPSSGERFEIRGEAVLGREDADVSVPTDGRISRRHAVARVVAGGVEVEDLGSRNGTWVNGERITGAVPAGDGAEIRVGRTTFTLELAAREMPGQETRIEDTAPETAAAPLVPRAPMPVGQRRATPDTPFRAGGRPGPRRGVATRLWVPAFFSFATIIATAVALVVYFIQR
jgi:pSer/pThr/pTyr-binding forkhead associated (FHA) protein